MAKVKDILGEGPTMKVNSLNLEAIDQNKLWVHYDAEADSIVIYLTGAPTRAVSVCFGDDIYLKVNPLTNDIVGLHIEAWERKFVPAHPDIQAVGQNETAHKTGSQLESAITHVSALADLWLEGGSPRPSRASACVANRLFLNYIPTLLGTLGSHALGNSPFL